MGVLQTFGIAPPWEPSRAVQNERDRRTAPAQGTSRLNQLLAIGEDEARRADLADRRQQAASQQSGMASIPALVREPLYALGDTAASLQSTMVRPFNRNLADDMLDQREVLNIQRAKDREGDLLGETFSGLLGGVSGSIAQMAAAASVAGVPGVIATFGATRGNEALKEAADAGLEGIDRTEYAARATAIESGITTVFQGLGLGGAESLVAGRTLAGELAKKVTAKAFFKQLARQTAAESVEEVTISTADLMNQAFSGVNPNALNPDNVVSVLGQTLGQTALTMGIASSPSAVRAYINNPSRTNYEKLPPGAQQIEGKERGEGMRQKFAGFLKRMVGGKTDEELKQQPVAPPVSNDTRMLDELLSDDGPGGQDLSDVSLAIPELKAQFEAAYPAANTPEIQQGGAESAASSPALESEGQQINQDAAARALQAAVSVKAFQGKDASRGFSGAASAGLGTSFATDSQKYAAEYGEVSEVDVSFTNPYEMPWSEFRKWDRGPEASFKKSQARAAELAKQGHDGIVVTHVDGVKEFITLPQRAAVPSSAASQAAAPADPAVEADAVRHEQTIEQHVMGNVSTAIDQAHEYGGLQGARDSFALNTMDSVKEDGYTDDEAMDAQNWFITEFDKHPAAVDIESSAVVPEVVDEMRDEGGGAQLLEPVTSENQEAADRTFDIPPRRVEAPSVGTTRGQGVQYHGAKGEVTLDDEGYSNENNIYGGFNTFYTTDAKDMAQGYGRDSPDAKVYRVKEINPVRFYDMEQPATDRASLTELFGDDPGIVEGAIDSLVESGIAKPNLREVMDEIRLLSSGEGMSKSDVQELFDNVTYRLQEQGFGGMSHVGGLRTGSPQHTVKIYFNPVEQVVLEDADGPAPESVGRDESLLPDAAKEGIAPEAINRAEGYLKSLGQPPPPPAEGMVRLYRGQPQGASIHESAFWSDDRGLAGVAIPFAMSGGRELVYVDVPESVAQSSELQGVVTDGEYQLPQEYREKAETWGDKAASILVRSVVDERARPEAATEPSSQAAVPASGTVAQGRPPARPIFRDVAEAVTGIRLHRQVKSVGKSIPPAQLRKRPGHTPKYQELAAKHGIYTDRVLMMVLSEKEHQKAKNAHSPQAGTSEAEAAATESLHEQAQSMLKETDYSSSAADLVAASSDNTYVLLQDSDGQSAVVNADLFRTVQNRYPNAVAHLPTGPHGSVKIKSDGEVVAVLMPVDKKAENDIRDEPYTLQTHYQKNKVASTGVTISEPKGNPPTMRVVVNGEMTSLRAEKKKSGWEVSDGNAYTGKIVSSMAATEDARHTTRFVLRNAAYEFHTIEGRKSEQPVVYRVPTQWYADNVRGRLPDGLRFHGFADWTGREYSITLEYGRAGMPDVLKTGELNTGKIGTTSKVAQKSSQRVYASDLRDKTAAKAMLRRIAQFSFGEQEGHLEFRPIEAEDAAPVSNETAPAAAEADAVLQPYQTESALSSPPTWESEDGQLAVATAAAPASKVKPKSGEPEAPSPAAPVSPELTEQQKFRIATMLATNDLASVEERLTIGGFENAIPFAREIDPLFKKRNGFVPDAVNQRIFGKPVSNDTGPGVTVAAVKAIAHPKHYTVEKKRFGKNTSGLEDQLSGVEAKIEELQRKLAANAYDDPLDRLEDSDKAMTLDRQAETFRQAIRLKRAGSVVVVESKAKDENGNTQKFYVMPDGMVLQEGYSEAFTLEELKDELAEIADPNDVAGLPASEEAMPYQGPVRRTRPDPVDPEDGKPIGENWPTQTESTTEDRVPVSQITASIEAAVKEVNENFRLRAGRMGIAGRKLRGIYNRLTGIARTQKSNDLPGGLHEAAHALKEAVSDGGSLQGNMPPDVQSDLVELGKRKYEEEPLNGWLDEGFSEYVRMWGTVPDAAQQVAPNATTWFEKQFLPSLPNEGQAWRKVQAELQTWEQQGGAARIDQSLVRMEVWKEKRRKWKENAKNLLNVEAWFEMFLPYKRLDEQRAKQLGRPLRDDEETYGPAKAMRMSHYGQALDWVRNGVRGWNNVRLSRPLVGIGELVPQDQKNEFWVYAAARRTIALAENKPAMRRYLSTEASPVTYSEPDGFQYADGTAVPQAQLNAAKAATYRDAGPWSEADARQVVADFDNPRFQEAFDLFREVDDAKYKFSGIASPTMKAVGEIIMKNDAGDHIPMHAIFREIDNDYRAESRSRTSNAAQGTLGKRLSKRGSKRERRNPLEVIVEDLVSVIATTNERYIIDRVIAASEAFRPDVGETVEWVTAARKTRSGDLEKWNDDGTATVLRPNGRRVVIRKPEHLRRSGNHGQLGYIINEVPPDLVKAADRSMDQIVDEIARKVRAQGGELLITKADGSEMKSQELAGEVMSFFTTARQVPGFDNPIVSYYDGVQKKVRWFEVDKNLMGALKGMSMQKLPAAIRWMTGPVRTMKMGNVIYNPSFGLIRNPLRDLQDSYQTTASSESPLVIIRDTIMGFLTAGRVVGQQWKGLGQRAKQVATGDKSQAVTADPYAEMSGAMKFFQRYGGGISTMVGVDQAATMDLVREIEGDLGIIDVGKDLLRTFRDTVGMTESVARVREVDHLAKEMGITDFEVEIPIPKVLKLLLASKENAGPDFSANGYIGRYVNQLDPFANVSFQAARTQLRALKRDPKKYARHAATFMAGGILYWAINKDEEWYKRLGSAKYHNYYWKIGDNVLKLPRGQYSGTLIAGLIESMFDAAYQRDPDVLAQFAEQALEVLLPNALPLVVQEARDQWKNEDSFFNMKIVPPGLETLPPSEQADLYTTRLSTLIGAATDPLWPELQISPKRLDHALKAFFGAAPQDALDLIGLGKASTGREWEAADFPVFGTLFVAGGTAGRRPKPVSDLYDLHQKFLDRKDSRRHPETETDKRTRLMLQDTTKSISMLSQLQHLGIPADGTGYNQWRMSMGRLIESTEDTDRKGHLKALLDAAAPGQQLLSQKDQRSITKLKAEIAEDTLAYAKAGKLPSASMAKAAYDLSAKHPTPREHEFPEEFKARKAAALEERASLVGILKEQGIPAATLSRELARYYFQRHGVAKSPAARKKQQAEIQQRLKALHYHLRKD